MQFVGIPIAVFGYACIYTAVAMLKRAGGETSGSVLYWFTGIESLGAPSGGAASKGTVAGGGSRGPGGGNSPRKPKNPQGLPAKG